MRPLQKLLISILATPAMLGVTILPAAAQTSLVAPQPLTQNGKFMPAFGSEAIVHSRYTVRADGSVSDIKFPGGFGSNTFLQNTLKQNMSTWTFTPGTANGEAVDFYNQEYTFVLRLDPNAPPRMGPPPGGGRRGAPPAAPAEGTEAATPTVDFSTLPPPPHSLSVKVKDAIDTITVLVGTQDYDKALKEIDKLERRELRSVFDYSLVQEIKSGIYMAKQDPLKALEASQLATQSTEGPQGTRIWFLPDELLENALRSRFLLAATLRQNGLAWETYTTLDGKFDLPADDQIHALAQSLKAQLDAPEPLGMLAGINDKVWTHTPTRRIFTVTDVDGKLSKITARCERSTLELKYQKDVDWTLPEPLGACSLDFEGKKGTQFTLYEFAE